MSRHDITINGIGFTPNPKLSYANNYVRAARIINDRSQWHKIPTPEGGGAMTKEYVERFVYRSLVLGDLWFILYFVLGVPESIANTEFAVKQCKEVETGPTTLTLDIWSRGHLKAVDVNEQVPTPYGWKKHGDLVVGDEVFNVGGQPVKIIAKTKISNNEDCYRVTFCDGYSVVVGAGHLWTVSLPDKRRINNTNKRRNWKIETLNTQDLKWHVDEAINKSTRRYPTIQVASAVSYPVVTLPLDPYVLGVWLGDGTTHHPYITSGLEDADEMTSLLAATGVKVTRRGHSNAVTLKLGNGIRGKCNSSEVSNALKSLGIYHAKRIPESYRMSCVEQRWALLQGLMDTDGTCHRGDSQCVFSAANVLLAQDVFDLCQSLGLKATILKTSGLYKGERRPFWMVQFRGRAENPPFRLSRKAKLCSKSYYIKPSRRIVSIALVASLPVSCIQVDSKDGLYLIGKNYIPTHNSSILSIAETVQYHLKYPERCTLILSYKKRLSEKFAGSVKQAYETEFLKYLFPDVLYSNPLSESPSWSIGNGITVKRKCSTRGEPTVHTSGLVEGMAQGFHCERLVFDDFETEDMAGSPEVLDDAFSKFQMAQYMHTKAGNDTQRVIGTIYSHAGPIVRIKDMKNGDGTPAYHTRIVPGTVDGSFDGAPVLWSQEVLDKEKTRQHYAMQVLCDPTPKELRKFNSLDLLEVEADRIPKNLVRIMVIDPAGGSDNGKGDNWAIFVIGIEPKQDELGGSDVYILNAIIDTMNHTEAIDAIARMYLGSGIIQKIGVEKVALSTTEIHIKAVLEKRGRRISVEDDTLVILKPSGREKKSRISSALSWPFSNGKIHVSKSVKPVYRDQLRSEMDKFPYWKDDGLDALAYAFDMIKDLDVNSFRTQYRYASPKYRGLGI